MAYDEYQADRIKQILNAKKIAFSEKKMMGGWCLMVDGKMLCGMMQDKETKAPLMMARVGQEFMDEALLREGAEPMTFTGKPLKGFLYVRGEGFDRDEDLEAWIQTCLDFNPMAKASKKKSK